MAFQYSTAVLNAKLNQIQTTIGASPSFKVFSGAEPVNCAQPDPSGLLCSFNLPPTWLTPASGGAVLLNGTWQGAASANGVASSWRIYDSSGNCHIQGSTSDITFSTTNFTALAQIIVTTFTITAGNQ